MKYLIWHASIVFVLLSVCGCNHIIQWGRQNFDQGATRVWYDKQLIQPFIRSTVVHDEFSTLAHFDVLWLSDTVRKVYAQIYAQKRGRTAEQRQLFLRRQLEENNHFIVFYVLAPVALSLANLDGEWSILLKIGFKTYIPSEIKRVELSPEYQLLFHPVFNRFRTAYQVRFDAKNSDNLPLITKDTANFSLVFRSFKKEVVLTWNL